ncbi:polysaccharide deacetylase family protein [Neobacillus drentensis]|uniref:polysaccharide deacetylase family protein n=1 Tax=Neobacillus drentensis TaxID=220684 RepID=UPI00300022D3
MGDQKQGWAKGTIVIVIFAIGFLFAGVFVNNYFKAKAASKPITQEKNEFMNHPGQTSETIVQNTNDLRLEKEMLHKRQEEAMVGRNKQEREATKTPEKTTTDTATTQPSTPKDQETTKPPSTETKPANAQPSTAGKKTIYLTFDDGPAAFSGEIIALLEKFHFKATFFMIDGNIRKYPDAVKLMVQTGETVALHSVSHDKKVFYASATSVINELNQNRNTLKEVSGVDSYIMRTPYGSVPGMTAEYRKAVTDNGYLMWDWNIDSKDWYYKDARYVESVKQQLARLANHNGSIVILMHERKETLAHLPDLLDYLSKQGYEGKAIDSSMTPVQFKVR